MNFFNIGTAELLLIFAIALIVVGPRRLPEIAQGLGKIMRDLRQMSQEFTVDVMREINAPAKENEKTMTNDVEEDFPRPMTNDHLTRDQGPSDQGPSDQ